MSEAKTRLDKVYQASNPEQLRESYQAWATHYESDLVDQMGYDKPQRVGEVLVSLAPPEARVLDVGSGTGLVGAYLSRNGFKDLTGLDFSDAMIAQARRLEVYRDILHMDLSQPLSLETAHFDVVVGVGVFTEGHASPTCLSELVRVVRAGGYILFSLRDDVYQSMGFDTHQNALVTAGRWKLRERKEISDGLEGRPWSIWVYEVVRSI